MRVTIDLMKKSTQIIDLSDVINPRVGDDDLLLPLHIVYGDNQTDMRGKDVEFISEDTNKQRIYIAGTCNTDTPGDNLYMGNLTFRFPAGTFKADGTYDPDKTMFRIVDKATNKVISSVNVNITVMKNSIEFDFDPDNTSYDSRMEEMLHGFHDKGQAMLDDIKNLNDQAKSNVSGDTAATAEEAKQQADANAGDISGLKGEIAGARGRYADLPGREDAQDTAINQKESINNANANYAALKQKDANQDREIATKARQDFITNYLSRMSLIPEAFENVEELKTTYPNGKPGIMVTVNSGHAWLYIHGAWKDAGTYQSFGSKEVEDARVSAELLGSARYQKAGAAIRGQITAILNTIGETSVPDTTLTSGYYLNTKGVQFSYANNTLAVSDYIPVKAGQLAILQNVSADDYQAAVLYDGNKKLVKVYQYNKNNTRVILIGLDGYLRYTAQKGTAVSLFTPKYLTADDGDKIREQITAVLSTIGDVSVPDTTLTSGYYLNTKGVQFSYANNTLAVSDYIPVKAGQLAILQNVSADDYQAAVLYDGNKKLVKVYQYNKNNTRVITVPQDGYIRYTAQAGTTIEILTPKSKENIVSNAYADMSLFQTVGVIGDSYASGELVTYNGDTAVFTDHYPISWGQILARKHGFKCINYSSGGKTTTSWLADANHGLPKLLADDPCELYILALGINDRDHFKLGTVDDISTDPSSKAIQTFYGCYSKIIASIIKHAPKAKLILSTMAANDEKTAKFNQAIIDLAGAFNIAYINQSDDPYFTSSTYKNMQGGHPRAVGYSGMATAIDRLIVKCMATNSYFNDLFI